MCLYTTIIHNMNVIGPLPSMVQLIWMSTRVWNRLLCSAAVQLVCRILCSTFLSPHNDGCVHQRSSDGGAVVVVVVSRWSFAVPLSTSLFIVMVMSCFVSYVSHSIVLACLNRNTKERKGERVRERERNTLVDRQKRIPYGRLPALDNTLLCHRIR